MRIAVLAGNEETFPRALIDRLNAGNHPDLSAELPVFSGVAIDDPCNYDIAIDRVSYHVPFFRSVIEVLGMRGTQILNDPWRIQPRDAFSAFAIAARAGVSVPWTMVLPNKSYRADVTPAALRNLAYPVDWSGLLAGARGPALLRPASPGTRHYGAVVSSVAELLAHYDKSSQATMMLQDNPPAAATYRAHVIGDDVIVAPFDPASRRVDADGPPPHDALLDKIKADSLTLSRAFGLDFNVVEWNLVGDDLVAVEVFDPCGSLDFWTLGADVFDRVIDASMLLILQRVHGIERAKGVNRAKPPKPSPKPKVVKRAVAPKAAAKRPVAVKSKANAKSKVRAKRPLSREAAG